MPASKKKPARKSTKKTSTPRSHSTSEANALKLVDEAAALLRKGISTGASTTDKARLEAKKKAHTLLNKASSSLSGILDESTSVLRKVINKI